MITQNEHLCFYAEWEQKNGTTHKLPRLGIYQN